MSRLEADLGNADPDDLAGYAAAASRDLSPIFTARFVDHSPAQIADPLVIGESSPSYPNVRRLR